MADPFPKPPSKEGPFMSSGENFVSFNFVSEEGYGKILGTVHGSPEFVAEQFGIKDTFDGKVSTLMKRAITVDGYFKTWYKEAEANRPKA